MDDRPVLYFTRVLPGYRIKILEALNDRLNGSLVVCSGDPPASSSMNTLVRNGASRFRHEKLTNRWWKNDTVHAQAYRPVLSKYHNVSVVLAEESPRSVTLPFLLRQARRQGASTILWGHFSSNSRNLTKLSFSDRYRLRLARSVDACVTYTEPLAEWLAKHVSSEKIFVARNTIDMDRLFALREQLEGEGRQRVRARLGLPGDEAVILFIGRLIAEKGTRELLEVFSRLHAKRPAHLVVIGDGPERPAIEQYATGAEGKRVHVLGSMNEWETSAPYLYAADVMVMPGYLGLSVNHCFAFGLPVVSQASPDPAIRFHSPEGAYLVSGENGMMTRHGDIEQMVDAVETVLDQRDRFSGAATTYARENLTVDRMVSGLHEAVRYVEQQRTT